MTTTTTTPAAPAQAPLAAPDVFALPEDARAAPLAVLANDPAGARIVAFTDPAGGALNLRDGVLFYTPDSERTGADAFSYTISGLDGALSTAAVSLTIRPSLQQPQRALDPRIAAEISPSGRTVELREVATLPAGPQGQAAKPIGVVTLGERVFVLDQGSPRNPAEVFELVAAAGGRYEARPFFDIDAAVLAATGRSIDYTNAAHGGLRGLAFHPEFARNGLLYAAYMEQRPADAAGRRYLSDAASPIAADSVLAEWRVDFATGRVIAASHRELFRVGMPVYDHPVKEIAFDPFARPGDENYGLLFIAHGDGSEQSATAGGGLRDDALGKILRIDPLARGGAPFTIPASNPFLAAGDGMIDAAYSIGHRNPHTLSFARLPGGGTVLVVAEPGRDNFEEVNLVTKGGNYGWSDREGPLVHRGTATGVITGVAPLPADEARFGTIFPAAFLGHDGGAGASFVRQAIAGAAVVANGSSLEGQFLFGDFAESGRLYHVDFARMAAAVTRLSPGVPGRDGPEDLTWARPSELTILFDHDGDPATTPVVKSSFNELVGRPRSDLRFGQGPDGEILIINKQNGEVYVIADSLPPEDGPGVVVVRAAGVGGPSEAPTFTVLADGVAIGSAAIQPPQTEAERREFGLGWRSYVFDLNGAEAPQTLRIVYANDGPDAVTGLSRDLWIDRVSFGGRTYQAETDGWFTPASAGPGRAGPREALYWNGALSFDADPPAVLRVIAGGTGGPLTAPRFSVRVDGETLGAATIAAPQTMASVRADGVRHQSFAFTLPDEAPDSIEIVYANDGRDPGGEDRNLYIDRIEIDDRRFEAESFGFYVTANPALRAQNGPREAMFWNGVMAFDLSDLPIA